MKYNKITDDENKNSIYSNYGKNYNKFLEQANLPSNSDIVKYAKKHFFGLHTKKDGEVFVSTNEKRKEIAKAAMRFILEEVHEIMPSDYFAIYGVNANRLLKLESLCKEIIMNSSDEVRKNCCFVAKRIIFFEVYPEYYKEKFLEIKPIDIVKANDDIKESLVRAARPANFISSDIDVLNKKGDFGKIGTANNCFDGEAVDKIIWDAMYEFFLGSQCGYNYEMVITKLANNVNGTQKMELGCCDIIKARKCYPSELDFFFLNSPIETQIQYIDQYIAARESCGLKNEPILDYLYKIYNNSRNKIEESYGVAH